MESHQQLSLAIATSDLRYVCGQLMNSKSHPRTWPFSQWGAMIAFETQKNLHDVHDTRLDLDWEDEIAAAARHGGKYFDGRETQIDSVISDFRVLAAATTLAYYPEDRRGPEFDFLRDDLSVVTDGSEVLLTNVTGHFMVGLPPNRAADLTKIGPHVRKLAMGIGQMASALTSMNVEELMKHGKQPEPTVTWWDGDIADLVRSTFGGELRTEIALALVSIHSTIQSALRWAWADCCQPCRVASLKHRFIVLHHAVRSLQQLGNRLERLGPIAKAYIQDLSNSADLQLVISERYRKLRNGWLHLGLGDIASILPKTPNILSPVFAYTQMEIGAFSELVDRGLNEVSVGIGAWLAEPGLDGKSVFEHLHLPPEE
ncbi:hypothetical protein OF385_14645 [Glutamicibacter sp. JL.03c]|uniref:hypothetical protein n=1 Tax=Glutamicibacter sp. JL.03c TaxID=2984842 RepID=UPI0021F72B40|nr:hypothetical protein [Glutamicibacter sp. JL.03c]UYQ77241.1 hypothetical protein OF385_14645 [Glutamicibacter sp. JL.03c]